MAAKKEKGRRYRIIFSLAKEIILGFFPKCEASEKGRTGRRKIFKLWSKQKNRQTVNLLDSLPMKHSLNTTDINP
jgi:hypothetical protein